jgi:hypothetical protein
VIHQEFTDAGAISLNIGSSPRRFDLGGHQFETSISSGERIYFPPIPPDPTQPRVLQVFSDTLIDINSSHPAKLIPENARRHDGSRIPLDQNELFYPKLAGEHD